MLPHSFWGKDGTKKDVLSLLLTQDVEVASFPAHGHTLRSDHLIACEKGVEGGDRALEPASGLSLFRRLSLIHNSRVRSHDKEPLW